MRLLGLLVTAVLVGACSSAATPPAGTAEPGATAAAGATSATGGQATPGGAVGGSLFEKAKAVKHFCDLLPTDLVPGIIDVPTPPQEMQFPPTCSVYGTKTALAFSLASFDPIGAPPADGTPIAGLGTGAYLERLSPGNFSLWVGLSPDGGTLLLEVDNSDGKDHTDQVVNLTKAVLQKLGG